MNRLIHFLSAFLLCLNVGLSTADDTDIYVGDATVTEGVIYPNVLFVLDTSSSMTNTDNTGVTRLDRMKSAMSQIISSSNNVNMGMMRFHREGGPVLFPVSNIHAAVSEVTPEESESDLTISVAGSSDDAEESSSGVMTLDGVTLEMINKPDDSGSGTLNIDVAATNDDAEEYTPSGTMQSRGSSDLELMHESPGSSSTLQTAGIRFRDLSVPSGSALNSSRIRFQLDETKGVSDAVTINIYGQLALNPGEFSSSNGDISGRTKTNAVVSWQPTTGLSVGDYFYTPDLNGIIEEVMDQDGWSNGNSIVFIFEQVSGDGVRCVESYDGSGTEPRLEVSYSSGSGSEDQTVGYRFQKVMVPKGADITSARLEFQAAQSHDGVSDLVIKAQNIGDAPAFSADTSDISGRSTSTASVFWSGVEAWTQDERYQSPDLSTLVQELVNHNDWCGGNSMAFIVTGVTGARRVASSYDGDTSVAPSLHISYDPDSVQDDACINQIFQAQVVSGNDDVEERSNNTMYMDSSDLELVEDSGAQTVGIRFRNVRIPKDTSIVSAELIFTTDETGSSGTTMAIKGEAADDSAEFSTSDSDVSSRSTTSASVSWSPDAWDTVGETHSTPDLSSIVQEIVNRSGWADGNAMTFIITGSGKRTAESYNGDASAAPVLRVMVQGSLGTGFLTVRDKLLEITDGLNYKSGTPILDTLYEAARYWRGEGVHYGKTRGFGHDPDDGSFGEDSRSRCEHTRLSHSASYTGGTVVRPAGCSEDTPNSTACIDEYISGSPEYVTPISEWCQANYMILLSDGNGYGTQSVSLVNNNVLEGGYSCSTHDNCSVELAEYLYKEDQHTLDHSQTVSTYTIGFNLESTSPDFLTDVANAGGGTFSTADTAAELADVFQAILQDILSRSTSFTAPAVSVNAFNKLFHDNDVYFSLFLPTRSVRWSGNLKKYSICEGNEGDTCTRGDILDASTPPKEALGSNNSFLSDSKSYWSLAADGGEVEEGGAGENIPAYGSRLIYTYTSSTAPSNATLATDANRITAGDAANAADDPLRVLLGAGSLSDTEYSDLIYWILGKDLLDEDEDGSSTDDRWGFADPLHSQPLVVTYGKDGNDDPIKKIFIGTNDGALRMVNANTGVEEWAFIPQAMLEMQKQMKSNSNGDHLYGMDGDLKVYTLDVDGDGIIEPTGDKVWLFAGMRRGGRNLYAFDVTPSSTITDGSTTGNILPKLKWRIEGGVTTGFGALGQTWSAPSVVEIPYGGSSKHALVFGGGYHSDQDAGFGTSTVGNAIYAVDITDGSLLWSVSGASSGATVELTGMDYPIPSDLALMDSNADYLVDRAYVGDLGGQVWRLDIQATDSGSTVSGARLATLSSSATDTEKRKFFYSPDVAQVYDSDHSTNPEYDLVFIISGNRADPTDLTVHNRVYGLRDDNISGAIPADFTPLTSAGNLYDATANLVQQGSDAEKEAAITALKAKSGWYFDLSDDGSWIGEKGLSNPIILDNRVFFTTYIPGANESQNDTCGSPVEGFGRLYAVDILNASAVYPNWDGTGDTGNYTKEDRDYDLWAGIPSAVVPIFQQEGVTMIVGGGGGGGTFDPNIELPMIRTFWLQSR